MTQEIIDTGSVPNDGSGDPLREAFNKINNNFANLFTLTGSNTELVEIVNPFNETTESSVGNTNTLNIGNVYITNTFDSKSSLTITPSKPLSVPTPLELSTGPYGEQEYINIGATPNDGNGDPLRVAFNKINNNFSNLFLTATTISTAYTLGITSNQVIFEIPTSQFYQGQFQIRSSDPGTPDMQDITLSSSITNNLAGIKFTGYGTLFEGNTLCHYDMDVFDGNVRLLINPIKDAVILHFIASEVTFIGIEPPGVELALNGYAATTTMGTEDGLILTTES